MKILTFIFTLFITFRLEAMEPVDLEAIQKFLPLETISNDVWRDQIFTKLEFFDLLNFSLCSKKARELVFSDDEVNIQSWLRRITKEYNEKFMPGKKVKFLKIKTTKIETKNLVRFFKQHLNQHKLALQTNQPYSANNFKANLAILTLKHDPQKNCCFKSRNSQINCLKKCNPHVEFLVFTCSALALIGGLVGGIGYSTKNLVAGIVITGSTGVVFCVIMAIAIYRTVRHQPPILSVLKQRYQNYFHRKELTLYADIENQLNECVTEVHEDSN